MRKKEHTLMHTHTFKDTNKHTITLQATVGAGLPIMSTLQGLLETGDRVKKIEGILSGTLSFIFNTYKAGEFLSR